MSKGEPELILTVLIDHGDGTGTFHVWTELPPDLYSQISRDLGEPEMTGMTAVRYHPESGAPQVDLSTEMNMRSEGS